ncbi:MAG: GntR family transcriptional regulator, partial [Lentisphaerae bacterium]|nr:GntR family transcriptional regulator [Lentisphaerota bacterium]
MDKQIKYTKSSLRPDAKFVDVANSLRRDIVQGVWLPEQKLPTWDILCKRFSVARPTLTRALAMLKREGFIAADSTRSTLVTTAPPHLNRYALVFPSSPGRKGVCGWNLFWDSLAQSASDNDIWAPSHIDIQFNVHANTNSEIYQKILDDLRKYCLAGAFVAYGEDLKDLVSINDIPIVRLFAGTPFKGKQSSVGLNWRSFHQQAADALLERGCRKVAVLSNDSSAADECAQILGERGVIIHPRWVLCLPGTMPEYARNLTRLLVTKEQYEIPDGLIITDDNLVPAALAGALDEGRRIPDDLEVVAHCNWPGPPSPMLHIMRLGFSARQILSEGFRLMKKSQDENFAEETVCIA